MSILAGNWTMIRICQMLHVNGYLILRLGSIYMHVQSSTWMDWNLSTKYAFTGIENFSTGAKANNDFSGTTFQRQPSIVCVFFDRYLNGASAV